MTEQTVKHVESILNYIKKEIIKSISNKEAKLYKIFNILHYKKLQIVQYNFLN